MKKIIDLVPPGIWVLTFFAAIAIAFILLVIWANKEVKIKKPLDKRDNEFLKITNFHNQDKWIDCED